jgi:hypothetical protein
MLINSIQFFIKTLKNKYRQNSRHQICDSPLINATLINSIAVFELMTLKINTDENHSLKFLTHHLLTRYLLILFIFFIGGTEQSIKKYQNLNGWPV